MVISQRDRMLIWPHCDFLADPPKPKVTAKPIRKTKPRTRPKPLKLSIGSKEARIKGATPVGTHVFRLPNGDII